MRMRMRREVICSFRLKARPKQSALGAEVDGLGRVTNRKFLTYLKTDVHSW
jgi:hypothetical protein